MRGALWAAVLLALLLPSTGRALDEALVQEAELQFELYDLSAWEEAAGLFSEELRGLWNGGSIGDWMRSYAQGAIDVSYDTVFETLGAMLLGALRQSAGGMGVLLGAALLTGIVGIAMEDAKELREIVSYFCYALALTGAAAVFIKLLRTAREALSAMGTFAQAAMPVLVTMLSATGSVTSAGMLTPLMAFLTGGVMEIFRTLLLPLVQAAAIMAIAGNLTGRQELQRLGVMGRSLCKWGIGLVFTVFLGIVSLQGLSAGTVDSIGIRTAKYTLDKAIPVVGGAVSGTLDTVRGCAILVKNASGAATALLTLAYALQPAVYILAGVWALKLCGALCAPVSDGRIARMLGELADTGNYLFASVTVAALMFMILSGLVMAIGNA